MAERPNAATEANNGQGMGWALRAKRAITSGALALMCGAGAAGAALGLTEAETNLGPHRAEIDLNYFGEGGREISIDMGPLGSVHYGPSPMRLGPFSVGAEIDVKEIPNTNNAPLSANDVVPYEQLFFTEAGREAAIASARDVVLRKGAGWFLAGASFATTAYLALGSERRRRVYEQVTGRTGKLLAIGALSVGLLAGSSAIEVPEMERQGDPLLLAFGLEGWRVEGKVLETLVSHFGPRVLSHIEDVDSFYEQKRADFLESYQAKLQEERRNPGELSRKIANGEAKLITWSSDLHCNLEMAALTAAVAETTGSAMIVDTGDQTMAGTAAEGLCVSVIPNKFDGHVVVAMGNHDSPNLTAEHNRNFGNVILLDGKTVEVDGLRILGDMDVQRSKPGVSIHLIGDETLEDQAARLTREACGPDEPDIVAVHNPEVASRIAESGCVPFVLSGHTHELSGPHYRESPDGSVVHTMTNGSTGGAGNGKLTLASKLGNDATIVNLVADSTTGRVIGTRVITFHKDGSTESVTIGDLTPLPVPEELYPAPVPGDEEAITRDPLEAQTD